ncbi:hypothetical protein HYPSUDRAFT_55175 [Hypholoma sublateritium FD-334 SS-4]|uniref:Uncharacterized protein n=1 Tax=Hypholoma sublateritium (strain FD-334 SS-4) TaxID=945553 RepID=A0A0D2ME53_HYPSF|nr:hypothetical protein HYPSUDRAFT_55175 [Hypholoma sublateritium FD-334 SS-4]
MPPRHEFVPLFPTKPLLKSIELEEDIFYFPLIKIRENSSPDSQRSALDAENVAPPCTQPRHLEPRTPSKTISAGERETQIHYSNRNKNKRTQSESSIDLDLENSTVAKKQRCCRMETTCGMEEGIAGVKESIHKMAAEAREDRRELISVLRVMSSQWGWNVECNGWFAWRRCVMQQKMQRREDPRRPGRIVVQTSAGSRSSLLHEDSPSRSAINNGPEPRTSAGCGRPSCLPSGEEGRRDRAQTRVDAHAGTHMRIQFLADTGRVDAHVGTHMRIQFLADAASSPSGAAEACISIVASGSDAPGPLREEPGSRTKLGGRLGWRRTLAMHTCGRPIGRRWEGRLGGKMSQNCVDVDGVLNLGAYRRLEEGADGNHGMLRGEHGVYTVNHAPFWLSAGCCTVLAIPILIYLTTIYHPLKPSIRSNSMAAQKAPSGASVSEFDELAPLTKNQKKKKRKKAATRAARAAAAAAPVELVTAEPVADAAADIDSAVKDSARKHTIPTFPDHPKFPPAIPPLTIDASLMDRIAKNAQSVTVTSQVNNTFQIQLPPHGESSGSDVDPGEASAPDSPHKAVFPNVEAVFSTTTASVINLGGATNRPHSSSSTMPLFPHSSFSISSEDGEGESVANVGVDSDEAEEIPVALEPLPSGASMEERMARMEKRMELREAELTKELAKGVRKAQRQTQMVEGKLAQAHQETDHNRKEIAKIQKDHDNVKRELKQARKDLREAAVNIQALTAEIVVLRNTNQEQAACFAEVFDKLTDLYARDSAHVERIRYVERWAVSLLHYAEGFQTPEICAIQFRVFLDTAQYRLAKAAKLKCNEINGPDVWSASLGLGGHDGRGFVKTWATLSEAERNRINDCRLTAARKALQPALDAGDSALLPITQSLTSMRLLTEFQSSIRLKGNAAAHGVNLFPGVDEKEMIELIRSKDSGLQADERQAMETIFIYVYFPSDATKEPGA